MMTGSENRGERNREGINSDRTWSRCDREVRYGVYAVPPDYFDNDVGIIVQQAHSGVNSQTKEARRAGDGMH
jgi:hypothetical protein